MCSISASVHTISVTRTVCSVRDYEEAYACQCAKKDTRPTQESDFKTFAAARGDLVLAVRREAQDRASSHPHRKGHRVSCCPKRSGRERLHLRSGLHLRWSPAHEEV